MKKTQRKLRDGTYLLPNLLTSLNLFAGFYAIIQTLLGYSTHNPKYYSTAAIFIIVGTLIDTLDGRMARLTKTQSQFGMEYDSLADLTTFGMASSFLMFSWGLKKFGEAGWLVLFLYFACVALRLARFNVQAKTVEKENFQGLPCPAAAGIIASIILFKPLLIVKSPYTMLYLLFLPFLLGFLMVSSITYRNFKTVDFQKKLPLGVLLPIVGVIILIAYIPKVTILSIFIFYVCSGIVEKFVRFIFRKRAVSKEIAGITTPEG